MASPGSDIAVDLYHQHFIAAVDVVRRSEEAVLANTVEDGLKKTMLLAVASRFELELSVAVQGLVDALERTAEAPLAVQFLQSEARQRRYHAWFDWDSKARNANRFFSLFGGEFRTYMRRRIGADDGLRRAESAFIEVGSLRNGLVHNDLASYTLDRTSEQVRGLYLEARDFVALFPDVFHEYEEAA